MNDRPSADRQCVRPDPPLHSSTQPLAAPIYPTSVWQCDSTQQADQLLAGELEGYVYQRDGHPNADHLAHRIAGLHGAERAMVLSSGMAALSAAVLSHVKQGQHIVVSDQLYGRSSLLLLEESARLGIEHTVVDMNNHAAVSAAIQDNTKMVVVETLANPLLRCADIPALAKIAHQSGALLLVDNTFATPMLCQPIAWGADLVMESVSKMMNGHSDLMLGALCGRDELWERVPRVVAAWGLASSPFDCWLASRGLATLPLRMERACASALAIAQALQANESIQRVDYPGLADHIDHPLVQKLCGGRGGSIVTFQLQGGRAAADKFIAQAAGRIPFCPSLGEICTTVSHPESTSHRGLAPPERERLGITGGTLRLSVGLEQPDELVKILNELISC